MQATKLDGFNEHKPDYVFIFNGGEMKIKIESANSENYLCSLFDSNSSSYRIDSEFFQPVVVENLLSQNAIEQSLLVTSGDLVIGSTQTFRHSQFSSANIAEPTWAYYPMNSVLGQVYRNRRARMLLIKCNGFEARSRGGVIDLWDALVFSVRYDSRRSVMYLYSVIDTF